MQNDKLFQNIQDDKFNKQVSNKLENHRMPVDTDCWLEIEKQIKPKRKKLTWYYIGSAAVVIGILMLFIYPFNDNKNHNAIVAEIPITETNDIEENNSKTEAGIYVTEILEESHHQEISKKNNVATKTEVEVIDPIQTEDVELESSVVKEKEPDIIVNKKDSVTNTSKENKKNSYKDLTKDALWPDETQLMARASSEGGWTFGVAFGSGNGVSNLNHDSYRDGGYYVHAYPNDPNYNDPSYGDISEQDWDVKHKLPISFGFMLKKNFNKTFAVETGLVYTYLSSELKRKTYSLNSPTSQMIKSELELHYLGIPINGVVTIWSGSKWDIYGSAGIMLEKGIRSRFKTFIPHGIEDVKSQSKSESWIHGAQWSVNSALGVAYNITPSWGLYLEPQVSYYFDNDQPLSVRTDKSTVFNLNLGVNFNLK